MNNRQAGRRRGRGGQRQQGGPNRIDNGSRIDNRARGNAAQLLEKYKNLAGEAQRQGDRVNTEYYLQFADHYFRVLNENRARFEEQRRPSNDEDDEDEGEFEAEASDRDGDRREPQGNRREGRDYREQGDGERDRFRDRPERSDRAERQDRGERMERADRQERPDRAERRPDMANGHVAAAPRAEQSDEGAGASFEPQVGVEGEPAQAPRRRGRPRRNPEGAAAVEGAPAADSVAIDADRLPPSLGAGEGEATPRRRGRRPRVEATEVTPA